MKTLVLCSLLAVPAWAGGTSTPYTCEQEDFKRFISERCFRALNRAKMRRAKPAGFPLKSDRVAIATGLIDGQRQFYPLRPEVKMQLLAFSMCETEGNPVDIKTRWGYETGWTGWNIHRLRAAAAYHGLDFPRSDAKARSRLLRDHRWAGYLTMAACAADESDMGGLEHAFMVKTHGFNGFLREELLHGRDLRGWPSMRRYQQWLSVLAVVEEWDGTNPVVEQMYAAMSAKPKMPPDRRMP